MNIVSRLTGEHTKPNISRRRFMSYGLTASGLYLMNPGKLLLGQNQCSAEATRPDILGPFYRAGAPERYALGGKNNLAVYGWVMSTACQPISNATIEVWQATTDGAGADYLGFTSPDYEYYAVVPYYVDEGFYVFWTDMPGRYAARPIRHIHYRVRAKGYRDLVSQLYFSNPGTETEAQFDIVLVPQA